MIFRSYTELIKLPSFKERFDYLKLDGKVGEETFGFDRFLNQKLYRSAEWKAVRNVIISRDLGCDLGIAGREIFDQIFIHHMNPITPSQLKLQDSSILDPEYLITVSYATHNALHYGSLVEDSLLHERSKNDTCPWR